MSEDSKQESGIASGNFAEASIPHAVKPALGKRLARQLSYGKWFPQYAWQRLTRWAPTGQVHLIFALADHFEPAIVPEDGRARASR